jgi:hypothetical protein
MKELILKFNENNELIDVSLVDEENVYFSQRDLINRKLFSCYEKKYIKEKTLKELKKDSFQISEKIFNYIINNFDIYRCTYFTKKEIINLFPEIEEYLI